MFHHVRFGSDKIFEQYGFVRVRIKNRASCSVRVREFQGEFGSISNAVGVRNMTIDNVQNFTKTDPTKLTENH